MVSVKGYIFLMGLVLLTPACWAQRGPGGVSYEQDDWVPTDTTIAGWVPSPQSTCRIWLDASTLSTLADGDPITVWNDISRSYINDAAAVVNAEIPPYFREDPANSINGFPVVTFEEGRFLQLISSLDLNLDKLTTTKSVFFAFRTSTDVAQPQVLYEEGGCARGFNIYIQGGFIYVGAYDLNIQGPNNTGTGGPWNNGRDFDNTPQWGYTFVRTPIQANSTYVLSAQFSAPTPGVIHNNTNPNPNFFIRGWLNGQLFDTIDYSTSNQTNTLGSNTGINGIGTLWSHPDPIGLGAVNTAFLWHETRTCNATGTRFFQGRFAEFAYYNDLLNETQRIILQNYLASKYFANAIADDKYNHKANYGVEVIGIGQQTNSASNRHLRSQGRNPFEISVQGTQLTSGNQYFLTGHNNQPLTWTATGVPDNSPNIRRLRRIWRVDETGVNMGAIRFRVDTMDLPTLPAGFGKMVLLLDETNPNFPNFSLGTTKVLELFSSDGRFFEIDYDFPDNSFFTLAMLRPEVNFTLVEDVAIEGNPPPAAVAASAEVRLNYQPSPLSGPFTVDYMYNEVTALQGSDFDYNPAVQAAGVTIPAGQRTALIPFQIINDLISESPSSELFRIILLQGANTTPGLFIGSRDTLEFLIYDNDSPPIARFEFATSNVLESTPLHLIKVLRFGDLSGTSTVRVRRAASPNQGTATYGTDYTLQSAAGWQDGASNRNIVLTFAPGEFEKTIQIDIFDDNIYENEESINLILQPLTNISVQAGEVTHQARVLNDEPLPTAYFVTPVQNGFESFGDPKILIEIDRPSAFDTEVSYVVNGVLSTASLGVDYNIQTPGVVQIPAMATQSWPNLLVYADLEDESDETVVLELTGAVNATLGAQSEHTYTIVDYAPFEWRGAAGVGRESDNIIWVDADLMSGSHNQSLASIPNFSPRNIDLLQSNPANQATLQTTSNLINSRKSLLFDGSDFYNSSRHPAINQSGSFRCKWYHFVVRTGSNVSSGFQVLYHQGLGNGNRGLSIYITGSRVFMNVWQRTNAPTWGGTNTDVRGASSITISPNTAYLVSCHMDLDSPEPFKVYINGQKGSMLPNPNPLPVGAEFLGDNSDPFLGRIGSATRFHGNAAVQGPGHGFVGFISEFIKYNEPQMNETRRRIIENYLSAKYNIALFNAETPQVFQTAFANAATPDLNFGHQVAGVGVGADFVQDVHLDGQGPGQMRVRITNPAGLQSLVMWGHNNVPLNHSWPWSGAALPTPVVERSGRVWKVFKTLANQEVNILLHFSGIQDAPAFPVADVKLLYHTNANPQDFSNATIVHADTIRSGSVAEFRNLNLPAGSYVTLATTSSILPLPISLLHFTGRLLLNGVELRWATATEVNNDYFDIERCGPERQWRSIARVPGAGNASLRLDYVHMDYEPLIGVSYYRLKQVDFDGTYTYSEPIAIVNTTFGESDDLWLYPNPSSGGSVLVRLPKAYRGQPVRVQIVNMHGAPVYSDVYPAESELHELRYGTLAQGIYAVHVLLPASTLTARLVVQ
jgi:hypothetical protein